MKEWYEGYAAGTDYPGTYIPELNPFRALSLMKQLGCLSTNRPLHACELGFGTGLSFILHAAASDVRWWGTDFSPGHAQHARDLAVDAGLDNAHVFDQSFRDFCSRDDLPEFDFIGLHGIWSWVSEENRQILITFFKRRLRVGGIVYLGYNTFPGHAQMAPVRNLMKLYFERMTPSGSPELSRAQQSVEEVEKLFDGNPHIAEVYPLAFRTIQSFRTYIGSSYVAHEYFNQEWSPMSFFEVASQLGHAKLRYACSSVPVQNFDIHFLVDHQIEYLNKFDDLEIRETFRDFLINRQFRKDYWIKGGQPINTFEIDQQSTQLEVVLAVPKSQVARSISEAVLLTEFHNETLNFILDQLISHEPRTIMSILRTGDLQGFSKKDVVRTLLCLVGNGAVAFAQPPAQVEIALAKVFAFNRVVVSRRRGASRLNFLASALTGGGVRISQESLAFIDARDRLGDDVNGWVADQWNEYENSGIILVKNGVQLSRQECIEYFTGLAEDFRNIQLPYLLALRCLA